MFDQPAEQLQEDERAALPAALLVPLERSPKTSLDLVADSINVVPTICIANKANPARLLRSGPCAPMRRHTAWARSKILAPAQHVVPIDDRDGVIPSEGDLVLS